MTTASTTSPPATDFESFARDIARRRAADADPQLPRNAGTRRTPSKRALLAAIERAGGKW